MNFNSVSTELNQETYEALKTALEISKWPDGSVVTKEQQPLMMEAIILWEQKHLPEDQRTGFLSHSGCASKGVTQGTINLTDILDG